MSGKSNHTYMHTSLTFLVFKIDLTTFVTQADSVLKANLWNLDMK